MLPLAQPPIQIVCENKPPPPAPSSQPPLRTRSIVLRAPSRPVEGSKNQNLPLLPDTKLRSPHPAHPDTAPPITVESTVPETQNPSLPDPRKSKPFDMPSRLTLLRWCASGRNYAPPGLPPANRANPGSTPQPPYRRPAPRSRAQKTSPRAD